MALRSRSPLEQRRHDEAIRDIVAEKYAFSNDFHAHTNPGNNKNFPVEKVLYPDIVLVARASRRVEAIAEVETESSVNYQERLQWLDYSKTRLPFYLFVPAGSYKNAADIVKRTGIRVADIIPYGYHQNGKIWIGAVREKGLY